MSDIGGYRSTDPDTSVKAAESIDAPRLELLVWRLLKMNRQGLAIYQIADALGFDQFGSISPRLAPLCRKGFVVDSGERRVNPASGRRQIVWILKPPDGCVT